MKKKLEKLEKSSGGPANAAIKVNICYLGFVVSSELPPPHALTHALVKLDDTPHSWHVIELSEHSYPTDPWASVPRYFRSVFVVAVNALLQHEERGQLKHKAVILDKHIAQYAKIASDLRNWARADRVKSASPDFPKIRMAIHRSLFAAHGTGKKLDVVWKGESQPNVVFFRKPETLQRLNLNLTSSKPFETVTIRGLAPESEWSVGSLTDLARSLVIEEYGNSWQELYREALVKSIRTYDFIELSALSPVGPPTSPEQDTRNRPAISYEQSQRVSNTNSALRILQSHHRVLLTGPSGSGKTTTLQHMAWQFATGMQNIGEKRVLPLFVPMKWFGLWSQGKQSLRRFSAYLAFWVRETIDSNLSMSDIRRCDLFSKQTRHAQLRPKRDDILDAIRQGADDFFSDESGDFSDVVLLLDGLNEVPEEARQVVERQLDQLLKRVNRVVVTTRSHRVPWTPLSMTEFKLCELSDEQIAEYFGRVLRDGERIFTTQIRNDASILSMARNPFYLSLIVDRMKDNPNAKAAQNRALCACQGQMGPRDI